MTSGASGGGELPGFSPDDWAPPAGLVAVDEFEQVVCWLETKRRISELPLQETNTSDMQSTVVNSLSVYECNDAGKIRHLDIPLQRELSASVHRAGSATSGAVPAPVVRHEGVERRGQQRLDRLL